MLHKYTAVGGALLIVLAAGCTAPAATESPLPGSGGSQGESPRSGGAGGASAASGGSGGSRDATGGSAAGAGGAGTGGMATGGSGGEGGASGQGGASQGGAPATDAADPGPGADASTPPDPAVDGGSPGPVASGQGPVAGGKIVFTQDFEKDMNGTSRSPTSLPADRIQLVADPTKQRGQVVKIQYQAGDDFRTSGGTEPRSWLSSADGYTAKGGTTVSVAFGFMTDNPSWGAHFGQIIRDGGPLWMLLLGSDGSVTAEVHRGSGGGKAGVKVEAMKWYDFRIDTNYSAGGAIKFYMNGQLIGQGTGAGGANGRFDCGIYWYKGAKQTRTAWISNISIGEL